jgi:uncharacterized protein (TIGR01777 family)
MQTVLIAGGTGMVGMHLSKLLKSEGYEVIHLSRKENLQAKFPAYKWDLKAKTIDERALEKADFIINLAGAGIADARWTDARKKLIIDSRVNSTLLLRDYIQKGIANPKAYISASAIGYYGDTKENEVDETAAPSPGEFLSDSTVLWEKSIDKVAETNTRTVTMRIGIVFSTKGGALEKMLISFNFLQGAYFGDGQMWTSWVHIEDLCRMFQLAMENPAMQGVYNAAAPNPARNKEIIEGIKEAKNSWAVLIPVPAAGLKLLMGEMSQAVLRGTKVSVEKIKKAGFTFNFPELVPALKDILKRKI